MKKINLVFALVPLLSLFCISKGESSVYAQRVTVEDGYNLNLGQIKKSDYATPVKVVDYSIMNGEYGFTYYRGFLRLLDIYKQGNVNYGLFTFELYVQNTPGSAASSTESIEFCTSSKLNAVNLTLHIETNSRFVNQVATTDYWPKCGSDLKLPTIVVTENHSQSLTIGSSFDVTNNTDLTMGYDTFGFKAQRGVNLNLNGSYTYAYSVQEQYTDTMPSFSHGYTGTNDGFNNKFMNFSNEAGKTFTYVCGALFDCKVSNSGTYGGKFILVTLQHTHIIKISLIKMRKRLLKKLHLWSSFIGITKGHYI